MGLNEEQQFVSTPFLALISLFDGLIPPEKFEKDETNDTK